MPRRRLLLPNRSMILSGLIGGFGSVTLAWMFHLLPFSFPGSIYGVMAGVIVAQLIILAFINLCS